MKQLGIRVDVDTYRGTKLGVPRLLEIFDTHKVKATFVFSVGPDNMGRHVWRLLRPSFLAKMLRSNAPGLYGWDILLRGTIVPGPIIADKLPEVIRAAADAGHEIGLHAWDHHAWQARVDSQSREELRDILQRGWDKLRGVLGAEPVCTSAPAWKVTDAALLAKEDLKARYHSDCRGTQIFYPVVNGEALATPQIPTTLPSYDELIGRDGITDENYNECLLSRTTEEGLNSLAIHAEAEGILKAELFDAFCRQAQARGFSIVPFGALLPPHDRIRRGRIEKGSVPGREGWVACGRCEEPCASA